MTAITPKSGIILRNSPFDRSVFHHFKMSQTLKFKKQRNSDLTIERLDPSLLCDDDTAENFTI
jgi:hypothetical protein